MATQVNEESFGTISVNPGGNYTYQFYSAPGQDSYIVNIGPPSQVSDIGYYWTFALPTVDWDNSDTIVVNQGGTYEAGGGNDTLTSQQGTNGSGTTGVTRFFGGPGDDTIGTSQGADVIYQIEAYGGSGNDTIYGTDYGELLYGDTADSFTLYPTIQNPSLAPYDSSGDGNDVIIGYGGADTLRGNGGDDQLFGGSGADTLDGGDGSDFLYGGPRGTGNLDVLTGGPGSDVFVLSYSQEASNSGAAFWTQFFAKLDQDIASNVAKTVLQDAVKSLTSGFLTAALGPVGGDLAAAFVSLAESLLAGGTPQSRQDVMVVTDFDPREDVLVLPIDNASGQALTTQPAAANIIPGGSGNEWVMQFFTADATYAYVELSADFIQDMGISGVGANTEDVIKNILALSSPLTETNGTIGFSKLISPEISQNLPDGGFQFQPGSLPPGSSITFFGAIGGLVVSDTGTASYYPTIAGTNYVDALTLNTALGRPDEVSNVSVAQGPVFIHGFAGDDLIYGSNGKDRLYGDDGNDTLYSFASAANSGGDDAEQVSGGAGDDFLYGGDSLGIFDGGDGNDTFGVIAGQGELVMQVEIDLTAGYAAENPNGVTNGPAPVGDTAPFDSKLVRNQYTLTSIENAIGGPLNDWIKAASGSTIEGGPGADYLDAKAGNVTLSYASSSSEVVVDLYPGGSQTNLGDATGDVIGYNDVTNVAALIGSANDDTLGAWIEEGSFTFTGNGGSDLFQILGYTLNDQLPMYFITDFTREAGETDVIDLRQFGTPSFDYLTINGNVIGVSAVAGGIIDVQITLENFSQAITPDDFLFAGGSAPGSAAPSVDGSDPSGGADVEIDENGGACFSPDHRFCRGGGPGGAWDHAAGHSGKDWFAANPGWRCDG